MKTLTALRRSLLLVALVAVSWAAAAPHQAVPENAVSDDKLKAYFEDHPDAARNLFPDLINQATSIKVTVDEDVLADLIEKKTAQETKDEQDGRKRRSVEFNFSGATMGSDFNFQGVGTVNDSSHKDYSMHNSNNRVDSSTKDWSTHDSSHKDWSKHDSSTKDWSTHDSSHKDWSRTNIDESRKDYSQDHNTYDSRNNFAGIGWGK